jgi:type II secretory pathway pseudopilin PulG
MEMAVIVAILILLVAVIIPRYAAIENSEQLKSLESSVARLPAQALKDAVKDQAPVRLRFDGTSVVEEEVPLNGAIEQLNSIDLGSSIQVDQVQKNYMDGNPSSWDWTAYPDGTTDTGGVQLTVDSETRSLIIPASGQVDWVTGPLPDESQDQWTAGQLQQRST